MNDGRTEESVRLRTDGWTGVRRNGRGKADRQKDRRKDARSDGRTVRRTNDRRIDGPMDEF